MSNWLDISIIAVTLGAALTLDVSIFTLLKFRAEKRLSVRNWIVPITLYHMVLFGGTYTSLSLFGRIQSAIVLIGVVGSCLIAWLIYESLCEGCGKEPIFSLTDFADTYFNKGGFTWLIPMVLAVSWDAPLSAPGMFSSLQQFTALELFFGWIIFGVIVASCTASALLGAALLRRYRFQSAQRLAVIATVARWLQLSILGGFAVNSLWHSLYALAVVSIEPSSAPSFAVGTSLVTLLFIYFRKELHKEEFQIAVHAIWDKY